MVEIIAALIVVAIALWSGHKMITGSRCNMVRHGRSLASTAHDESRETR